MIRSYGRELTPWWTGSGWGAAVAIAVGLGMGPSLGDGFAREGASGATRAGDWGPRTSKKAGVSLLWPADIDAAAGPAGGDALWGTHRVIVRTARSPRREDVSVLIAISVPGETDAPRADRLGQIAAFRRDWAAAAGQDVEAKGAVKTRGDEAVEFVVTDPLQRTCERARVVRVGRTLVAVSVFGGTRPAVHDPWAAAVLDSVRPAPNP